MLPFKLHILGCGSALPTLKHFPTTQVVECRGKMFMVDCGEGAQLQMRRAALSFNKIGHIFVSHIHGDHCFGLIGMISTFNLLGRTAPLHVFGEEALGPILTFQLKSFCRDLSYEVQFHEIDTTVNKIIYDDRSLTVETIPLNHRLPCCGFLFREKPTLPHIRRDMIDMYEIPVSQIQNIKNGQGYMLADGSFVPNEKLVTPADAPRSYAYVSDTKYMPELCERLQGVSTLYHEATYGDDNLEMAEKYHHSTARQAAQVARDAHVGKLILGHYSSRYLNEQVLLEQAQEVFPHVRLTKELDIIDI